MSMKRQTVQKGFTLIEVMVAIVIGTILSAAAIALLVNSKSTYEVQDDLARLQENARFAMEMLMRDIRMAGYFGCVDSISEVTNHVVGNDSSLFDTRFPIDAVDHGDYSQWYPSGLTIDLPTTITSVTPNIDVVGGTDMISLRYMVPDTSITVEEPYAVQPSGALKVTAGADLEIGEIIAVTDCDKADIFQITNLQTTGSQSNVVHNTGAGSPGNFNNGVPGCPGANSHCFSKTYKENAFIMKLTSVRYFIGEGDNGPSLYRIGLARDPSTNALTYIGNEMVEGIEQLQLTYGLDTDGDDVPDVYRTAQDVETGGGNWLDVRAVRIGLVARTIDPMGTATDDFGPALIDINDLPNVAVPNDRRRRRVFTATVQLRNPQ
ncbi:MAG: PilW family protein [Pseudomonadota bacterium]|nr:PilW family protein [Pseudomonadota bacterium]